MEKQISKLFSLFTQEEISKYEYYETLSFVEIRYRTSLNFIPSSDDFLKAIPHISSRDKWEFKVLSEYEETVYSTHSDVGQMDELTEIEVYIDTPVSLKFYITKNNENAYLSIYKIDKFNEYLQGLPLMIFLNEFNSILSSKLIFECINDTIQSISTSSIAFISENEQLELPGVQDRLNRLKKCAGSIHWGTFHVNILPEDLYLSEDSSPIAHTLCSACGALLCMYLFDYISLTSSQLHLKIDGFKSLNYTFDVTKLSNFIMDHKTLNRYYETYEWILSGGYVSDKYSIARNIISINLHPSSIALSSNIIDSIRSNFRIYEKDNVQQYIQLRNEISNLLIDLQSKINEIVEGYANDFKNNLLVLISFFASVIVFGVISKDSPFVYFSNQVIILSWAFLLISYLYLRYSKREFSKKKGFLLQTI